MKKTLSKDEALRVLQASLGGCVHTDKESCFASSFDAMKLSFIPEAVVKVTTEGQVGKVLKIANKYQIPVTTRGAGSSLTGSATPVKSGWVLDVTGLNKIAIDTYNRFASVGAGAITGDIQKTAEAKGLFYPPDPSSLRFCTIGGNIACNAGGLRCIKYGVTRDYVVALKGYLPTGEPVAWGKALKKFASGYNLRDLWIGSEGTLGVITHAVLKLILNPTNKWTCLVAFQNERAALHAVKVLMERPIEPAILEFLDRLTVEGAEKVTGSIVFPSMPGRAMVLVELDGRKDTVDEDKEIVLSWAEEHGEACKQAESAEETASLWRIRHECSSAMFQHGNAKLNEDVVIPLKHMETFMVFVGELAEEKALAIPTFGHAGDGNFHVNIMYNRKDKVQLKHAEEAVQALMEKVVELDGAITGEHGIGLAKASFLRLQHSKSEIKAMLAVKQALDPQGILNPGKIFEPFRPWEHEPVKVRLPWDPVSPKSS